MELDNFKPTWRIMKIQQSQRCIQREEILSIIEVKEKAFRFTVQKLLANSMLLVVIMLCCQGG